MTRFGMVIERMFPSSERLEQWQVQERADKYSAAGGEALALPIHSSGP